MNIKLKKDYKDYKTYIEELRNHISYDNDYYIILDYRGRIYEEVADEKELKDSLYSIYQNMCKERDQSSFDDDNSYFRSNFESIEEENAIRAYDELKDDWEIKHIFLTEDENEIESVYPNIEFFMDF